MEKKIILANWKMNFLRKEAEEFADKLKNEIFYHQLIIAPPYHLIDMLIKTLSGSNINFSGQNSSEIEGFGPFTGEISPMMLKDLGCNYVLLGHSERRYLGETDKSIEKKISSASNQSLIPILCIGETLEEKSAGLSFSILEKQLSVVKTFTHIDDIIIAYEPRWSIGTSIAASTQDISEIFTYIENLFQQRFAKSPKILYGGSVNEKNAEDILSVNHSSGLLIGAASLKFQNLLNICNIR